MADISTYLAAIQEATYGEEVRGSIHDAIQIINAAGEVVLTTGTAVDSETSSVAGFYKDSLYLNTNTYILWKCTGTAWINLGTLKGEKGDDGEDGTDGNRWLRGTVVSGKSSVATSFAVGDVIVNDNYINTTENAVYHCSQATDTEGNSLWVYDFTMAGGSGGSSVWGDITNKPFTTVGSDFSTDGDELALATSITEKIPQSKPTSSDVGKVATVQSDLTISWDEGGTTEFTGTTDAWNKESDKSKYIGKIVNITDDYEEGGIDEPTDLEKGIIGGDEWTAQTYSKGDTVIYNNKIYRCKQDAAASNLPTDGDYWEETSLSQINTNLSNLKETLLWTNSAPTSNFSAQSLSIDISNYDYLNIWFKQNVSAETIINGLALVGLKGLLTGVSHIIRFRTVDLTNTSEVNFGTGYHYPTYANTSTTANDTVVIPVYIYGGKFN